MTVTEKSPKRFRFTLTARMQNYALNAIEHFCRPNEVFVKKGDEEKAAERLDFRRSAMTEMKRLGYMAQPAMEEGCILPKQYRQITNKLFNSRNLVGAWMNSNISEEDRL